MRISHSACKSTPAFSMPSQYNTALPLRTLALTRRPAQTAQDEPYRYDAFPARSLSFLPVPAQTFPPPIRSCPSTQDEPYRYDAFGYASGGGGAGYAAAGAAGYASQVKNCYSASHRVVL